MVVAPFAGSLGICILKQMHDVSFFFTPVKNGKYLKCYDAVRCLVVLLPPSGGEVKVCVGYNARFWDGFQFGLVDTVWHRLSTESNQL